MIHVEKTISSEEYHSIGILQQIFATVSNFK